MVKEFRGLGGARREDEYACSVMRDKNRWALIITIIHSYSDTIHTSPNHRDNKNIPPLPIVFEQFDKMIQPTLDSLKLYGNLKQY